MDQELSVANGEVGVGFDGEVDDRGRVGDERLFDRGDLDALAGGGRQNVARQQIVRVDPTARQPEPFILIIRQTFRPGPVLQVVPFDHVRRVTQLAAFGLPIVRSIDRHLIDQTAIARTPRSDRLTEPKEPSLPCRPALPNLASLLFSINPAPTCPQRLAYSKSHPANQSGDVRRSGALRSSLSNALSVSHHRFLETD